MSILIDIEMPTDCLDCPCADEDWMRCKVAKRNFGFFEYARPGWCPLKEITQVDIGEFLEGRVKTFNIPESKERQT